MMFSRNWIFVLAPLSVWSLDLYASDGLPGNASGTDRYDPDSYQSVIGGEGNASGTYILLQHGTVKWTRNSGKKTEVKTISQLQQRSTLLLKVEGSGEIHAYSICTGEDSGGLSRSDLHIVQSSSDAGRFFGKFKKHYASQIESLPDSEILDPLFFAATNPADSQSGPITGVDIEANYDLIRIGPVDSSLGRMHLSYSLAGNSESLKNVCWRQQHWVTRQYLPGYQKPNEAESTNDVFILNTADLTRGMSINMYSGDFLSVGNGPIGSGQHAGFGFNLSAPWGFCSHSDSRLARHGDTGRVSQDVAADDIRRLEISGKATPDGSNKFANKSLPAIYHLDVRLK